MIRRDVLSRSGWTLRDISCAKDGKPRVSICRCAISRLLHVAKDLIVGAILFDHINDVFDRRWARKQSDLGGANQSVVAHDLLRVSGQRLLVRLRNEADVPDHQRNAVLSTLFAPTSSAGWKSIVGSIGCATGAVHHDGRGLN